MSDLQDLIHRNAQLAFEQGVKTERKRIDAILDGWDVSWCKCDSCKAVRAIRSEIKGEQK